MPAAARAVPERVPRAAWTAENPAELMLAQVHLATLRAVLRTSENGSGAANVFKAWAWPRQASENASKRL